jgi:NADPH:quinone reductase-like Zn-dependent oxidoreductase
MKEQVLAKYGKDPAVFRVRDADDERVGDNQVRVRVGAFALNPVDLQTQRGESRMILPLAPPLVPGVDLAGTIDAVGRDVSHLQAGDRVFSYTGMDRMGAFSQSVVLNADRVAKAPAKASTVEAAALPLPALCALQAIEAGHLARGSRVLVHGGTGAVGSMAVQIAAHLGAEVAVTASAADTERARSLGAIRVIDHRTQRFEDELRDLDFVFDTVGGDTLKRSWRVVRRGGSLATLHVPPDATALARAGLKAGPFIKLVLPLATMAHRKAAAKAGAVLVPQVTVPNARQLCRVAELFDAGVLRTTVERTFPFGEFAQALTHFASGKARGRVVVETA